MIIFQEMRVKKDSRVLLFYRGRKPRWVCAVVQRDDGGILDHRVRGGFRESGRNDMDKIKVVHDPEGQVFKVWLDDPAKKALCKETIDRGYGFMLAVPSIFAAVELKPVSWKIR